MKLNDLLDMLPKQTKELVVQTVERHRGQVIANLDRELRFQIEWSDPALKWTYRSRTRVKTKLALPEGLRHVVIPEKYESVARIALLAPALRRLVSSGSEVTAGLEICWSRGVGGYRPADELDVIQGARDITAAVAFAERMLDRLAKSDFNLLRFLLTVDSVNGDVLGLYQSPTEEPPNNPRPDPSDSELESPATSLPQTKARRSTSPSPYGSVVHSEIVLYWGVIGLVAAMLDLRVEALTVVVLAHEYAHQRTHLGFARDGTRWTCKAFHTSERRLVESLAQYYTKLVAERMERHVAGVTHAYETLLPHQPEIYRGHVPWLDNPICSPEVIGATLARLRRRGALTYQDFDSTLAKALPPKQAAPAATAPQTAPQLEAPHHN